MKISDTGFSRLITALRALSSGAPAGDGSSPANELARRVIKRLDLLAGVAFVLALVFYLAQGAVLEAIGADRLSALWVARSPVVLFGTGLLLALVPRLTVMLIRSARLDPAASPAEAYVRLFVLSSSALLLELALIRWIGAEVRFFAYFKNFVLISIFLGFGLGFALGPRTTRLYPASLVGLVTLTFLVWLWSDVSLYPAMASQEQTWGHSEITVGWGRVAFMLAFFLVCLVSFFAVLCWTFAALVQEMGSVFERLPRIGAYGVNLVGSLAGIALFNLLSWAETPPVLWFTAGVAPLAVLPGNTRLRWTWAAGIAVTLIVASVVDGRQTAGDSVHRWSPYYRMSLGRTPGDGPSHPGLYSASVNRKMMSMARVIDPALFEAYYDEKMPPSTYALPFLVKPDAKRVLVLGMGLGNDVAGALNAGDPDRIVAVEIDPVMTRYARMIHPEHPLASPKVQVVVDDARHYVETTSETFDLVILGSLDSHTLLTAYSQLRTDNFLYTRECFERIRELLTDEGVLLVRYASDQPWIVNRIAATLRAAFGRDPILAGKNRIFCLVGPQLSRDDLNTPFLQHWLAEHGRALPSPEQSYPTDDRPFLTIASRWLPTTYWIAIGAVILMSVLAIRMASLPVTRFHPKFLLLGAAFLLAETRLITLAGLLFGVTWVAYGIAISLVLATLITGTWLAGRFAVTRTWPVYLALVATIGASQLLAGQLLEVEGQTTRILLSVGLFGPTFLVAGYVFAVEFARVETSRVSIVLASNLLGAVLGGLLEYQALSFGIASLAITAVLLYLAAGFCSWREA